MVGGLSCFGARGIFAGKNTGVGCHFPSAENFPNSGMKPVSPALGLITEPPGKPLGVFLGEGLDSGGKKSTKLA